MLAETLQEGQVAKTELVLNLKGSLVTTTLVVGWLVEMIIGVTLVLFTGGWYCGC